MRGHVYAVASGKGGVGKTTTAANLAVCLRAEGRRTVAVDGDLGAPNLADALGVDAFSGPTLHDVLADEATLGDALVGRTRGLAVVPGDPSLERYASIDPTRFGPVIAALAERFDAVVVDTGAGVSYEVLLPITLADGTILVTSPDDGAVQNAGRTADLVRRTGGDLRGLVITRFDGTVDPEAIAECVGADLLTTVPEDPAVAASTDRGKPLELYAPESEAAADYRRLAGLFTEGAAPVTGDADSGSSPSTS